MKQILFDNKKIFYRTAGKGNPVMLVHGFAEDGNIWNYQIEKLKEKFYVIAPDLPGSGKSEMLEGKITIEDYAEVLKAIADVETIDKQKDQNAATSCTLIGHSMGGYITLAFAEKYPELLDTFCLFHSTAFADDETKKEVRRRGIEFIKNNGAAAFLRASAPNLFSEKTKNENPELIEEFTDLSKGISPEALIQYYNAMIQRPDRTSVLKSFQRAILFIIGKHDTAVPLESSLQQCHLPAISHIHILQNSGHVGMWEEKDRASTLLLDFLTR